MAAECRVKSDADPFGYGYTRPNEVVIAPMIVPPLIRTAR